MTSIQILAGPPGPHVLEMALEPVLPLVRSNRCHEALFLVPSNLMVEEIRNLLIDREEIEGVLGLRIMTILDLSREVFLSSHLPGRIVTPLTRQWTLQTVLSDLTLRHFNRIRETKGFAYLAADFIRTLKEGGISPEDFLQSLRDRKAAEREKELGTIYKAYEHHRKEKNLIDREDLMAAAARLIGKERNSFLLSLRHVIITGFYDFSPLQLRLLGALSRLPRVGDMILTLAAPPDSPVILRSLQRLKELFPNARMTSFPEKAGAKTDALSYFRRHFLTGNSPSPSSAAGEAVEILRTPGTYQEVEEIARKIREYKRKDNLSFRDFAVVFRTPGEYQDKLREVFQSFHIPYRPTGGLPLQDNPLIRTAMAMLEIPRSGYRREAVIRLLRSDYIRFAPLSEGKIPPERIDLLSREAMIQGGLKEWKERIASRLENLCARKSLLMDGYGESRESDDHIRRLTNNQEKIRDYRECSRVLDELFAILSVLPRQATVTDFVEVLDRLLRTFRVEERIYALEEPRLIRRDQAAYRTLQELFDRLIHDREALFPGRKISLPDFCRILDLALSETTYAPDPPGEDVVLVADALSIRGLHRPVVLVGGLVEGIFPRRHPPNPVFGETDRIRLNERFGPDRQVPLAAHWREEEEILFLLAGGAATRKLALTLPRSDTEGRELLPSRYIGEIRELFQEGSIREENFPLSEPLPDRSRIFRTGELIDYTLRSLHRPVDEEPNAPHLLARILLEKPETVKNLLHGLGVIRSRTGQEGNYRGILPPPATAQIRREENTYSVTALEQYGACPFGYFCKRVLRLRPVDPVDEEMGALDQGSLLHRILERFYRQTAGPVTAENIGTIRQRMAGIVDEELAKAEDRGIPGHRQIWEIRKEEIRRILNHFLEEEKNAWEENGEIPSHFEVAFGMPPLPHSDPLSTTGPLVLPTEGEGIRLQGKIDRIDLGNGEIPTFSILDYKTGRGAPPTAGEIRRGESLQLPVYAGWAAKIFAEKRKPGHASFVLLRRGGRKMQIKPEPEEWRELRETAEQYIRNYVAGIRGGRFQPTEKKCSEYCRYREICRKDEK